MSKKNAATVPFKAPWISITLDRERRLLFDFNALIELGEATGENMLEPQAWDKLLGIKRDKGKVVDLKPSPKNLRAILWAALLADDPELTEKQVGAMLHPSTVHLVLDSLLKAQNAQADVEDTADKPRPIEAAEAGAKPAA